MSTTSTIPVTIGTTVIQFPNTGASPVWSEAVIEFVQAVENQFLVASGSPYDIAATFQTLTGVASPTTVALTNASFASGDVASFSLSYSVYLVATAPAASITQQGVLNGVFNTRTSTWSLQHEFSGDVQAGNVPYATFDIGVAPAVADQILLTYNVIAGSTPDTTNSKISYSAITQKVNS